MLNNKEFGALVGSLAWFKQSNVRWTQKVYARDIVGNEVYYNDQWACSRCLAGAVLYFGGTQFGEALDRVADKIRNTETVFHGTSSSTISELCVTQFNDCDGRSIKDIVTILEQAIKAWETETTLDGAE